MSLSHLHSDECYRIVIDPIILALDFPLLDLHFSWGFIELFFTFVFGFSECLLFLCIICLSSICRVTLLEVKFVRLCLLWKLISFSNTNGSFSRYVILDWLFFFNDLEYVTIFSSGLQSFLEEVTCESDWGSFMCQLIFFTCKFKDYFPYA